MAKVLHGDTGGNQLNASADKTQVYGLKGNDTLVSDGKSDVLLVGGGGNDSLIVMGGQATLSGGDGSDTFELNYSADKKLSAVIEDLQPSQDKIVVNFDGSTAPQLTSVRSGNDVVWNDSGGLFKVTLRSVRDNDYYDGDASNEVWRVLELTNAEREAENLSPLTMSDDLTAGASIRAEEITDLGKQGELDVYRHRRPNNEHFSTVLKKIYNNPVGENLEGGARSPEDVVSKWMSSESHKENILNSSYQKLGVGHNYDDTDPSDQRWYWVQLFANNLKYPESIGATNLSRANISRDAVSKFIAGTDEANTIENSDYGVTIEALGGNDSVNNSGLNVSISGGADNDTIENSGSFSTINAGTGDDQINLSDDAKEILIEYAAGDGKDSVSGFHSGDTLKILDDEFTPATVGNDIIVGVGNDSIKLLDAAASSGVQIEGTRSKLIIGTDDDETYNNDIDNATIKALGGNDYIKNYGSSSILDGGDGDDDIYNEDLDAEDYDYNFDFEYDEEPVELYGGKGDDVIYNIRSHCAGIYSGDGNDYILNSGFEVGIYGGADDDTVYNNGGGSLVRGEEGNDEIFNTGEYSTVESGAGNDFINNDAENATIDGGDGDDYINQNSELLADYMEDKTDTSINGGAGDDTIAIEQASDVTINGGLGDDQISLLSGIMDEPRNNVIEYNLGDGNDTIWGYTSENILIIYSDDYVRSTVGNDVVLAVGTDSITLADAASLRPINIYSSAEYFFNDYDTATITGSDDSNLISNFGDYVSINGRGGNDYINNYANNSTIRGDQGNDIISLCYCYGNLIQYDEYDDNDKIFGFDDDATLQIGDGTGTYFSKRSGDDLIVMVGDYEITLVGAGYLGTNANIQGTYFEPFITLTEGDDTYSNKIGHATIEALGGNDSIENWGDFVSINAGAGNDSIYDGGGNVTIDGGAGDDSIRNGWTNYKSLNGGEGDDTIVNEWGSYISIDGGAGNDLISLGSEAQNNLIVYNSGDGNDSIQGFNETSTLSISGGSYSSAESGDDIIVTVGDDKITLAGAASLSTVNIHSTNIITDEESKFIDLTDGDDFLYNKDAKLILRVVGYRQPIVSNIGEGATINAKAGNDDINNDYASNVSINAGTDNDSIHNDNSENVTILGGDGNDRIDNRGLKALIYGNDDNDLIFNYAADNVTIDGGADNDYISNGSSMYRGGHNVSIQASDGDDTIYNRDGSEVTIEAGAGDNSIQSNGDNVSILSGDGKDSIYNDGSNVSIVSGAGDDFIDNTGSNVSITAGEGNDSVSLSSYSENNFIQYNIGDGDDTIWGLKKNDSLQIGDGHVKYSTVASGDDIEVKVGNNTITLKNFRDDPEDIIIGESGTSGGTGSSGSGSGGGSSSGSGGGSSSGQSGGNTSGGTSASANSNSDASGGQSASGSSGTSASSGGNGSSGRGNSSSTTTAGNSITNPITLPENLSTTSNRQSSSANSNPFNTSVTTTQGTYSGIKMSPIERTYTGGNRIIQHYGSWRKITFEGEYRGAHFDGAGNFIVESSSGHLVFENATDKVINLKDAAGNDFIKAHMSSSAGTVDGRIYSGYQILNGSLGEDLIFAGADGSQLWGNADTASDTLVGGDGSDIFVSGKNEGSDTFQNASAADVINLNDTSLSDIVSTNTRDGALVISFNTGNTLTVQSTEALSANIIFSDGTTRRYNHATNSWQTE